jgi:hypothetical protein
MWCSDSIAGTAGNSNKLKDKDCRHQAAGNAQPLVKLQVSQHVRLLCSGEKGIPARNAAYA